MRVLLSLLTPSGLVSIRGQRCRCSDDNANTNGFRGGTENDEIKDSADKGSMLGKRKLESGSGTRTDSDLGDPAGINLQQVAQMSQAWSGSVKAAVRACHDVVVARAVLALAARVESLRSQDCVEDGELKGGSEGIVAGADVMHGCSHLVRALSDVAMDLAIRSCSSACSDIEGGNGGDSKDAEEEVRLRVVAWLELVVLLQGEGIGRKLAAVMMCGAGDGKSDSIGRLLAERFFATLQLLDPHIVVNAAEMILSSEKNASASSKLAVRSSGKSVSSMLRSAQKRNPLESVGSDFTGNTDLELEEGGIVQTVRTLGRVFGIQDVIRMELAAENIQQGGHISCLADMDAEILLRLWRATVMCLLTITQTKSHPRLARATFLQALTNTLVITHVPPSHTQVGQAVGFLCKYCAESSKVI